MKKAKSRLRTPNYKLRIEADKIKKALACAKLGKESALNEYYEEINMLDACEGYHDAYHNTDIQTLGIVLRFKD